MDVAFQSRIQVAIEYEELKPEGREGLGRNSQKQTKQDGRKTSRDYPRKCPFTSKLQTEWTPNLQCAQCRRGPSLQRL